MVGISFSTCSAENSEGITLIKALVDDGIVPKEAAEKSGLMGSPGVKNRQKEVAKSPEFDPLLNCGDGGTYGAGSGGCNS